MNVVFVAPLLREGTLRYVRAFQALPGVQLGVITQSDGWDELGITSVRVQDSLSAEALIYGGRAFQQRWGRVDRLLGHLEQLQIPLGQARDALGIPGMGETVARNFREKSQMKAVLAAAGVPVARHTLVHSPAELEAFIDKVGYPVVVKPPAGLGSQATFRLANSDDLAAMRKHVRPDDPLQVEEFVTGTEHTCETVSLQGRPVWRSGTHYLPGPLEVLENPWIQYCVLLPREDSAHTPFYPTNDAALAALGMGTGLTHMEWFRTATGRMVVSEVGARPPGVNIIPMMGLAHGMDMHAKWAELMVFERFSAPARTLAAGCAFFRGQGTGGRVAAVHGLDRAQEEVGAWVVDRQLPRVGQPRATGYEGEGWAIVCHPETAVVKLALQRLVTLVRVEMG